MGQTRPGQGTPISMSGVIRDTNMAPGVGRVHPVPTVPARASQNRVHNQRRRKRPLSTTESHQNQGAFPHRPISSKAAAARRPKHHQQTRRKPRHRHPRLENSPKPTRNPLPKPTKPNPIKTHEPTPSHRRFDRPLCNRPDAATGFCGRAELGDRPPRWSDQGPPDERSAISPPGRGRVLCPGLPPLLTDPPRRSVLGQEQPLPQIRVLPSPSATSPLINPERLSGSSQSQEGLPACS